MIKLLVVTHKQLYFSKMNNTYSSIGGFSIWHNHLSTYVDELHILAPVKTANKSPAGTTLLSNKIKFHHLDTAINVLSTIICSIKTIRRHNINFVICKIPGFTGSAGAVGSWFLRKPSILHVVGDPIELTQTRKTNLFVKITSNLVARVSLFLLCRLTEAIVTESFRIKDSLLSLGVNPKKVTVIPESSIDCTFFKTPSTPIQRDYKSILFVGRLSPEKGLLILIRAIGLLKKRMGTGKFKLVVVGNGKLRRILEDEIRKHQLSGIVELKGFVSHDVVLSYLNNCDVFVLPSLSEGRGKVLLEAMASAKPIVATCVGGIPEIVTDNVNGLLVKPNDDSALESALYLLLTDESLCFRLGQEGKQIAQNFSLEKIMPSYVSLITRVFESTL